MPRTTPPSRRKRPAKPRAPKAAKLAPVIPFPCPPGTSERLAAAAPQRWCLGHDNDGHSYLLPVSEREDFEAWADMPAEMEESWTAPSYAIRVDGDLLEFSEPTLDDVPVDEIVAAMAARRGGRGKRGGAA